MRCRIHRFTTDDPEAWAEHVEGHRTGVLDPFKNLNSNEKYDVMWGGPGSIHPKGRLKNGVYLPSVNERYGGRNGNADTCHGSNAVGATGTAVRTHGVRLKDRGWTPVGKETLTKQEWEKLQ